MAHSRSHSRGIGVAQLALIYDYLDDLFVAWAESPVVSTSNKRTTCSFTASPCKLSGGVLIDDGGSRIGSDDEVATATSAAAAVCASSL
jgi:hypothetical protein